MGQPHHHKWCAYIDIDVLNHLVLCTHANRIAYIQYWVVWRAMNSPARITQKNVMVCHNHHWITGHTLYCLPCHSWFWNTNSWCKVDQILPLLWNAYVVYLVLVYIASHVLELLIWVVRYPISPLLYIAVSIIAKLVEISTTVIHTACMQVL